MERKSGKIGQTYVLAKLYKTNSSGFIDGRAPGILNGCQDEKTVALLLKMLMKTPVVWSTLDNRDFEIRGRGRREREPEVK